MNEWTIELPYSKPPLTLNQRMHWAPKARWIKQLRSDARLLATNSKLPQHLDQVGIVLHWQATVRRQRDTDNPTPTLKALIDGLRDYGLVIDDDAEHVTSGCVVEALASTTRLWLTITDLEST